MSFQVLQRCCTFSKSFIPEEYWDWQESSQPSGRVWTWRTCSSFPIWVLGKEPTGPNQHAPTPNLYSCHCSFLKSACNCSVHLETMCLWLKKQALETERAGQESWAASHELFCRDPRRRRERHDPAVGAPPHRLLSWPPAMSSAESPFFFLPLWFWSVWENCVSTLLFI